MTSSNTPLTISHSSSPPLPVIQLLTANLTAPAPRQVVPVTYILLVPLIAPVKRTDEPGSLGGNGEFDDPRNRTMFIGIIALGLDESSLGGEGLMSS